MDLLERGGWAPVAEPMKLRTRLRHWAAGLALVPMASAIGLAAEPPAANADADAERQLGAFETRTGIVGWPRLQGCAYDQSFQGVVVGLVLFVDVPGAAMARPDSPCHVPARHHLVDWPAHLPRGRYVVAATLAEPAEPSDRFAHTNRLLKVLAVLGEAPNQGPLIDGALRRICARPGDNAQDRVCERVR